ncbi:hypothetical protein ACTOS9_04000 [Bacillus subtilis]|uniref:Thioredoxin domain-containing protein n=1 Tax=Bacillus subtilis TaxID=1423 RepID=A0AAX3RMQ0_BACIU|nr:hypothetical protein [Bacillus subtilis]OTQ85336.1 hypothetical protein BG30_11050 [Bacillus subtilis subsp. subtilis]UQZ57389.1 hypothetical protein C2H93_01965 [Bacillus subtilis]WEY84618.1 hypothetical protein P5633_20615 [Bacillus subtilis]WGD63211.1 hypothetical protein P5648_04090 [Bacillus subtilis]WGD71010.1 hypothetical protein P5645_18325 [Bacillus subtilis]
MNEVIELTLCLIIILVMNISVIVFMNKRLSRGITVKEGVELGSNFPEVMAENIEGDYISVKGEKARLFIFIDLECTECMKLFTSLKVYQQNYLQGIIFILIKNNLNKNRISKSLIKKQTLFIEEKDVFETFNVSSFPFFMGVDTNGVVIQRGYISKHNLIDFIA